MSDLEIARAAVAPLVDSPAGKTSVGAAIKAYGDAIAAGTQPPVAFNTAFGMTMPAFYSQFLTYEAGLPVPVNYLCGGL